MVNSDGEMSLASIRDSGVQMSAIAGSEGTEPKEAIAGQLSFDEDNSGGMGRHLGGLSGGSISRIIGTGIFSTPSSITNSVGSVGAALMLWILGFALSFAGMFVWLEFGSMIPRSGGEKLYLEAAYRRPRLLATVVYSTKAILLGFTVVGCVVFASNIVIASGHVSTPWQRRGIAVAVILFVTSVHMFMPKTGVWIMNVLGSIKVIILLFVVITGFVVLGGGVSSISDPHASFNDAFAGSVRSSGPYAVAMFKVLDTFAGWSNAGYVLNEVKRPVHTLKIAGPLGLGTCGVLYLLANVSYYAVATPKEIGSSGITVGSFFVKRVFGTGAQRVMSAFVALSALGNVMTGTFAQARLNQELAKEGVIPFGRFWGSSWPVGSPSAGLLLHLFSSLIVMLAVPFGDAYNFLIDVEGYPAAVINAFVAIGIFILRWRAPEISRPFKVWLPFAFFFLAAQCFLVVAPFLRPPDGKGDTSLPYWLAPIIGVLVLFIGAFYWLLWRVVYPKVGRFQWMPTKITLDDGTIVTVYVKEEMT